MFATAAKEPIIAHALGLLLQPQIAPGVAAIRVSRYCSGDWPYSANFYDLADRVRSHGQVLLGWRIDEVDNLKNFGQLNLNPDDKHKAREFSPEDDLLVLTPDPMIKS